MTGPSALPLLQGGKVRLRAFGPEDITDRYLGWLNDRQTMRYSNQRFASHTAESAAAYLRSFAGTHNLFLAIEPAGGGPVLGTMTAYRAPAHGTADIGLLVGERSAWGQGYGFDAWITLMEWLLGAAGLRKVTAGAVACNVAMLRIMEKSGMEHEGSRLRQEIVDGTAHDVLYYGRFAG